MRSLAQTPLPSVRGYHNTREYLYRGPPIYMNYSEIRDHLWAQYEKAVDNILKDPEAGDWLDRPLDQNWNNALLREQCRWENNAGRHGAPTRRHRLQRFLDQTAISCGILFWILHITSALGFILVDNASTSNDGFLERL